jgi:hypothetical protein
MRFTNKFNYPEKMKLGKEKKEFEEAAFNTFCVNFVNQVLKDNLNYSFEREDDSIVFSIDIPVLKQIQQQAKNIKNKPPLENFKRTVKPKPTNKELNK